MATFVAYSQHGEVGRIDAINNSQVFLILLFEFLVLRHTKGFAIRLLAAAIAFTGVYLLGNF
jgi:drug/metabolite transporter (DMT)-like permease